MNKKKLRIILFVIFLLFLVVLNISVFFYVNLSNINIRYFDFLNSKYLIIVEYDKLIFSFENIFFDFNKIGLFYIRELFRMWIWEFKKWSEVFEKNDIF